MLFLSISQMKKLRPSRWPTAKEQVLVEGMSQGSHSHFLFPQLSLVHWDPI